MPAIIGGVKVNDVGSGSIVQFGDTLKISPKSNSKTYVGSGTNNTGDNPRTNNLIDLSLTIDSDNGNIQGESISSSNN